MQKFRFFTLILVIVTASTMAVAKLFFVIATFHVVWCYSDAGKHANVGIIGGHKINIEQAPYMASLRLNGTYHCCGGSIIHERFILTAAHCIIPNRHYKIIVGADKINGDGELYDVEEIKVHKKYSNLTQDFDYCLIKLNKPLTFGPKVSKINLATSAVSLLPGVELNVTGWGSTGPKTVQSPNLLQVTVPMISKRDCREKYRKWYNITSHMMCAGNLGHDSCQGDSGGPLTHGDTLVGITSFGFKTCGVQPGVYAKVRAAYGWIMRQMKKLNKFQ